VEILPVDQSDTLAFLRLRNRFSFPNRSLTYVFSPSPEDFFVLFFINSVIHASVLPPVNQVFLLAPHRAFHVTPRFIEP